MARVATGDLAELERELGPRGSATITAENRNLVRRWMRARGIPGALVQGLPVAVLAKAYNDENDFQQFSKIIEDTMNGVENDPGAPMPAGAQKKPNRWAGECCICNTHVRRMDGFVWKGIGHSNWRLYCKDHQPNPTSGPLQEVQDETPYPQEPDDFGLVNDDDDAPQPFKPVKPAKPAALPVSQDHDDAAKKLQDAIRMIADGIAPKATPLDEKRVVELIKLHGAEPATTRLEIKINDTTRILSEDHRHAIFPKVLTHVAAGCHVYLVGPAGSGKSTIAEQVAEALDLRFHATNAVRSPFALTGYKDAAGNYHRTEFREAYENGGLFLFDEIDASAADALVTFNGAMAQNQFAFPDGMIDRHESFKVIAAANTIGKGADRQYVGRNQLDGATLDRFSFIEMGYDEKLERAIAGNDAWVDQVQAMRAAVDELKVRHIISPRASIMGARLIAAGMNRDEVTGDVVWKGLDRATVDKVRAVAERILAERARKRRAA